MLSSCLCCVFICKPVLCVNRFIIPRVGLCPRHIFVPLPTASHCGEPNVHEMSAHLQVPWPLCTPHPDAQHPSRSFYRGAASSRSLYPSSLVQTKWLLPPKPSQHNPAAITKYNQETVDDRGNFFPQFWELGSIWSRYQQIKSSVEPNFYFFASQVALLSWHGRRDRRGKGIGFFVHLARASVLCSECVPSLQLILSFVTIRAPSSSVF